MNQEQIDFIRNEWVPALRSGTYRQGFGRLKNEDDEYCCLGVACNVLPDIDTIFPAWKTRGQIYSPAAMNKIGVVSGASVTVPANKLHTVGYVPIGAVKFEVSTKNITVISLSKLNDSFNWTFEQIAQFLTDVCNAWETYNDA